MKDWYHSARSSEIAGYYEKTFLEVLLHKGMVPVRYQNLDLDKELSNA